jgi:glycerol-3-phosphate acyltransferase PlsX
MTAPSVPASGLPVAVDAMGGDKAPGEIVAGALEARDTYGVPVVLVGPRDQMGDTGDLPVIEASEVIAMDEEPGNAVRRKKDSSLVRAAEAVHDGRACATVSAGNTGAAMASALLRMGRLKGITRPGIATPIPRIGNHPSVLIDAGANSECNAAMLVQFAQMGSAYASARYHSEAPTVGLLSIGEEPTKGSPLVKETHALLADLPHINVVGNVEGRDLLPGSADVIVTDGFTGNVALKALEGSLSFFMGALLEVFGRDEETRRAADILMPHLAPLVSDLDPDGTGGAVLLGVRGVCVISHGSSSARAIVSAVRLAHEAAEGGLVGRLAEAVA